jgi:hypothetical protein
MDYSSTDSIHNNITQINTIMNKMTLDINVLHPFKKHMIPNQIVYLIASITAKYFASMVDIQYIRI